MSRKFLFTSFHKKTIENFMMENIAVAGYMREVDQQEAVYNGVEHTTEVLSKKQEKEREEGKPFEPDMFRASQIVDHQLTTGVTMRLEGAYAHYKNDNELECIRHILIALGSVCHALGWKKAEAYLNEQNRILFDIHQKESISSDLP